MALDMVCVPRSSGLDKPHGWRGNIQPHDGFCVYCYYQFGRFYVSGSTSPFFPDPEDAQGHIVREIPDENGILLAKENLPEAYAAMFIRYMESGEAQWKTI